MNFGFFGLNSANVPYKSKAATGGYQLENGADLLKKLTNQNKPTASASSGGTPPFDSPKDAIELPCTAFFGQAPARDSDTFTDDHDELPRQLTEDAGASCKMLNTFLKELEFGGKKSLVVILQIIVRD